MATRWGKKRKRKNRENKLLGDKVEVRSDEKGHEHSWHRGEVIAIKDQARSVQYDHRLCRDGSNKLIRNIKVPPAKIHCSYRGCIRPLPPLLNADNSTLQYGQCVDAYYNEAWWEGVIFDKKDDSESRLIFFPDTGDEMLLITNNLRITQDWDEFSGNWEPRKSWIFLELVEEFKLEWPLLASAKQVWFEVKGKGGFQKQLKRWTCVQLSMWRNLVWEAFSDSLKLVFKHLFKEPNLFGEEADKSLFLLSEAFFDDIIKLKSHSHTKCEELVCSTKKPAGKPKRVYKSRKDTWLPISSDIVPGPEFGPDSISEFIHMHECRKRPSPEVRLSVRKHLLFLGWEIEFLRATHKSRGIINYLYTSPKGKHYDSLLKVCKNLYGEDSDPNTESKKSFQKKRRTWTPAGRHLVPKAEFCPDAIQDYCLHLSTGRKSEKSLILNVRKHLSFLGWGIEYLRYNGAPKMRYISPVGTTYESLPKALQSEAFETFSITCQNKENILPDLSDKPRSPSLPNKPQESMSALAVIHPFAELEYCPEAIGQYYLLSSVERDNYSEVFEDPKTMEMKMKAKKHLAALGWSFSYTRHGKNEQVPRFTSTSGKNYYSLRTACKGCIDEGAVYKSASDLACIPPIVEPKHCPEVIEKYYLLSSVERADCGKVFENPKNIEVKMKAKKYLAVLGWSFCLTRWGKKRIPTFTSKSGKKYCSLRTACKGYIDEGVVYENLSDLAIIPPVVEPEYYPEAIEQYYLLSSVERGDYLKVFEDPKNIEVKRKAKKYLTALGWSFCYTMRGKTRVPTFTSTSGKRYYSLRTACKGCIDEEVVYETGPLLPVVEEGMNMAEIEEEKEEETLAQLVKSIKMAVKSKHKNGTPKVGKEREEIVINVVTLDSHLIGNNDNNVETKYLKKRKKMQSSISIKSSDGDCPKSGVHSCKRSKKEVENKLSWLMDNNVVSPREKVHYVSKEDNSRIGEGVIARDGIECNCCQQVFTVSNFQLHVCNDNHRPEGIILLEDGRSLSDCKLQFNSSDNETYLTMQPLVVKDGRDLEKSDSICAICRYGGELILCDQCPSAFHTKCLGLQCVPEGDWFCPSCCCVICGDSKFTSDTKEFGDENVLTCDQCEHKYHVGCLRQRAVLTLEDSHKENWFCGERCEHIFLGLQKLLGKSFPVGEEDITCTLLKYMKSTDGEHNGPDKEVLTGNFSKLNAALSVMHECFEPSTERETRNDVVEDVIFSRGSEMKRLNFQGFYTVLLEKNDEVVAAASMRVYGEKVAEIPLIGTRVPYRRLGMCRTLINELEKKLAELGVERLVLPAIPSVMHTWTESFGFMEITAPERLNFLDYTFLDFEGTIMCQKLLKKNPSPGLDQSEAAQTIMMFSENKDPDENIVASDVLQTDPLILALEAYSVDKVEIANQGSSR